ncbi:14817_t:CDS:1, partial [Racocetra persica]
MSNEKSICNNSFADYDDSLALKQEESSLYNSHDFLDSTIEELCDLYNKE